MSLAYRIMYRVGFTPWDTGEVSSELRALVEDGDALPPGRALDIGCGTGTQAVYLAHHGWSVTGIDAVEQPLRRAHARAIAEGVSVEWFKADVARLTDLDLKPGYTLVFDRGCYHGLRSEQRAAYVAGVTALAVSGATLLVMAFEPNRILAAPPGADEAEITATFACWELTGAEPDRGPAPAGPLRNLARTWYRLVRRCPDAHRRSSLSATGDSHVLGHFRDRT